MTFLKQTWYMAGWADEVSDKQMLARTIIDLPILLLRDKKGTPAAIEDRCPHRFAPLSLGVLEDGNVRCRYHGLKFDSNSGECIDNPHGPIASSLCIRSFPVIERHKILWIWMGDAEAATPDTIPDLSFVDTAPKHAISKGYMAAAGGHKLFEDNILDLSHADYLHPDTLGGGAITKTKAFIEEQNNGIFVQWLVHNELALPIFQGEMPTADTLTDMWIEVMWHPCGVMLQQVGATPVGQDRDAGINTWNAHIMTPETETRTHYFYCNSREYKMDDAEYNEAFAASLKNVFNTEDKPMIEGQQKNIGSTDFFELKPKLLAIDKASSLARRFYSRLCDAELSDGKA